MWFTREKELFEYDGSSVYLYNSSETVCKVIVFVC